jgi:hypothetical protein
MEYSMGVPGSSWPVKERRLKRRTGVPGSIASRAAVSSEAAAASTVCSACSTGCPETERIL